MERHEIEIEIQRNGEVKVHVQGAKGKQCMKYVEFLKSLVGEVKDVQLTHEYYEPEPRLQVNLEEQQHVRESRY